MEFFILILDKMAKGHFIKNLYQFAGAGMPVADLHVKMGKEWNDG